MTESLSILTYSIGYFSLSANRTTGKGCPCGFRHCGSKPLESRNSRFMMVVVFSQGFQLFSWEIDTNAYFSTDYKCRNLKGHPQTIFSMPSLSDFHQLHRTRSDSECCISFRKFPALNCSRIDNSDCCYLDPSGMLRPFSSNMGTASRFIFRRRLHWFPTQNRIHLVSIDHDPCGILQRPEAGNASTACADLYIAHLGWSSMVTSAKSNESRTLREANSENLCETSISSQFSHYYHAFTHGFWRLNCPMGQWNWVFMCIHKTKLSLKHHPRYTKWVSGRAFFCVFWH